MQVQHVPLSALRESPHNPRKTFDEAKLAELAEDIANHGLLQNLVVRHRPRTNGGAEPDLEVIAGARRLRALQTLAAEGKLAAGFTVPVQIVEADDLEALTLAVVENVQRDDIEPMEEARALATLRDAGHDSRRIADAIGKTVRHVQLRLALVDRLVPEAQKALESGRINLAQARVLATAQPKKQRATVKSIKDGWAGSTEDVRRQALGGEIPVGRNAFPLESYTGEFLVDPGDETARYFADAGQFRTLQLAAAKAKADELAAAGWKWAEVCEPGRYFHRWNYGQSKDKAKAGAVVEIDGHSWQVEVHTGLVRPEDQPRTASAKAKKPPAKPADAYTRSHRQRALREKSKLLQDAVAGDVETALRLACLALMGGGDGAAITPGGHLPDAYVLGDACAATLKGFAEKLPGVAWSEADPTTPLETGRPHRWTEDEEEVKAYASLRALDSTPLLELFAALVAARTLTRWNHDGAGRAGLGDAPLVVAVAQDLGIDTPERLTLEPGHLAGIRKSALVAMVRWHQTLSMRIDKPANRKTAGLAEDIACQAPKGVLPPTLAFGTPAQIEAAIAAQVAPGVGPWGCGVTPQEPRGAPAPAGAPADRETPLEQAIAAKPATKPKPKAKTKKAAAAPAAKPGKTRAAKGTAAKRRPAPGVRGHPAGPKAAREKKPVKRGIKK